MLIIGLDRKARREKGEAPTIWRALLASVTPLWSILSQGNPRRDAPRGHSHLADEEGPAMLFDSFEAMKMLKAHYGCSLSVFLS
jgi:hypothetical protein